MGKGLVYECLGTQENIKKAKKCYQQAIEISSQVFIYF